MVKVEYERIKATVTGTEYKARHILVEKEAEAKDIIVKLNKDPTAFEKLALQKSKDPGSRPRGGDLGWFDSRSGMRARVHRCREQSGKGQVHQETMKAPITAVTSSCWKTRGPGRSAAHGRGEAAAQPTASAAKGEEAPGCAEGQRQDRNRRRVRSRRLGTRVFSNKLMGVAASRSPD